MDDLPPLPPKRRWMLCTKCGYQGPTNAPLKSAICENSNGCDYFAFVAERGYSDDDMTDYARAAVAAYREDAERLEWLATRSMYAGRAPLADGTRVWFTPEIDFVCVKPDANALRAAIDSARGKGQAVPKLKVCTCGDRNGPDYCEVHAA